MIQCIGDDGVLIGEKRLEDSAVGIEAGCIEDCILCLEIVADGGLKLLVNVLGSADEPHRGHAESPFLHHSGGSLDEARVICQAKIVVGAEIQDFLAGHLDGGIL